MNAPDWKEVLPVPPLGGRLHEAWMTSFEQPDAGLLVEHLLPSLFGANHSLSQEVQERTLFFGELGTALESRHGRLTVISSPPRGDREPSQYPWLWRYLSHFTVGAESRAVQHAKLWAFHWKVDAEDVLELHVSSTNLTEAAFKGQVQAGWRILVPLSERPLAKTRATWGEFIPFLNALGKSAGSEASKRMDRLVELLGRAECPADVTFIASIPGHKSAARQIKQFEPTEIHVMAPTIGEWNDQTLAGWSNDVGIALGNIRLKWIPDTHPWADPAKWTLPRAAHAALVKKKVNVECLPPHVRFTKEHRDGDERWSHAKLYLLRKGKQRWLVITSANWSASAWGAGKQPPRNFELGVVFGSNWTDLEKIAARFESGTAPHLTDPDQEPPEAKFQWAEATWDGKHIELRARSSDASTPIRASVAFSGRDDVHFNLSRGTGTVRWSDAERTPLTARFSQGDDALEVDVLDLRSPEDFAKTPLPEVDPARVAALREAFLLQRYGGPAIDAESIFGSEHTRAIGNSASPTDYTVKAWTDARAAFAVVDNWRKALDAAGNGEDQKRRLKLDGEGLKDIYAKRGDAAHTLVAEEIGWRLQEMQE